MSILNYIIKIYINYKFNNKIKERNKNDKAFQNEYLEIKKQLIILEKQIIEKDNQTSKLKV